MTHKQNLNFGAKLTPNPFFYFKKRRKRKRIKKKRKEEKRVEKKGIKNVKFDK